MGFLNPLVLFGLAAAAIPIVVHLFHFRRPRELDFSTLRFLRETEERAMRRVQIQQWLILALRTLAVAALVLAFAQPAIERAAAGVFGDGAARSVAVAVDNSLSTGLRNVDGELLGQVRARAQGVVAAGGRGDEQTLVLAAPPPGALPTPLLTPEPLLDALEEARPRAGAETVAAQIARALSLLDGARHPRREIVVVSDLQASTLADGDPVPLPDDVALTLVPVGGERPANTAVTGLEVSSRIVEPGRPVQIAATVERFGGSAESVAAQLRLDGRVVSESAADVAPGAPATVRFTATPPARGWLAGEVRVAPDGEPGGAWDDRRFFALRVPPPPRVLLVAGEGPVDRLRLALAVAAEAGAVAVSESDESALARADLDRLDAVFLAAPRDLTPGEAAGLAQFVRGGGGVLLLAGDGVATGGADALLGALGAGAFDGTSGEPGGETVARLADAETDHPLFAGVFEEERPRLEAVEIQRLARYRPGAGTTLLGTTAGTPLLHEVRAGSGALLVLAVPPDPAWSDLSQRGLFVPLVLRAASTLAAGSDAAANEGLSARDGGTIRVTGADAGGALRLVPIGADSSAAAITPAQRSVPGAVVLDVDPASVPPGVYRVMQGPRELRKVAVNGDARESDPTALSPAEAAAALEETTGRPVRVLDGDAALAALSGRAPDRGVPLWTWLLGLALVCLVAETLLTTRKRPDPQR